MAGPLTSHSQTITVGEFFFNMAWPLLDSQSKKLLKYYVLLNDSYSSHRTDTFYRDIDPVEDKELYSCVRDAAIVSNYRTSAWIALASYENEDDRKLILKMLMDTEKPITPPSSPSDQEDVDGNQDKTNGQSLIDSITTNKLTNGNTPPITSTTESVISKPRQTALAVVRKYPHPIYWDCLKQIMEDAVSRQEQLCKVYVNDQFTSDSALMSKLFELLIKAIVAYQDDESNKLLLEVLNKEYDNKVKSFKNFKLRLIGWISDALDTIGDDCCKNHFDLVKIVAQNGKLSRILMEQMMEYDKTSALCLMSDVRYPIVYPDFELELPDESVADRLDYVLSQLIENHTPNRIDVICYYAINADHRTCEVANKYAVMFKEDPRILKALYYQLKHNSHGNIITESLKALLSLNKPEIDQKIADIVARRKKEKGFDRQGECDRLLEFKPRKYPS
eukprot:TRINITY_DN5306_c0_g1_i1.p1 TRINITY_DN5306_c0_g1~~TRINITY_DN5306_c0_g1_i1.p1  ORF type:complete len:448 (-),score=73.68 TRINITY_DN5306_c0_g1_i1:153-1496(-)